MAAASRHYESKRRMTEDLFRVLQQDEFAFATRRAVLEQIQIEWPEWYGKFDAAARKRSWLRHTSRSDVSATLVSYHKVPTTGCPYWSQSALEAYNKDEPRAVYHFEHAVPLSVIRDYVIGPSPYKESKATEMPFEPWRSPFMNANEVYDFLERLCIGVVMLRQESDLLPKSTFPGTLADWRNVDPWARYRRAGNGNATIPVYCLIDGHAVVTAD